jgi:CubicO group peptidase (beta-lactamase class C family)
LSHYYFAMRAAVLILTVLLLSTSLNVTFADQTPAVPRATGRGNPDIQFAGQSVDALIADFMREHDVACMAVAIVQAPYITRATGFGLGDAARRTLVSANTMFDIGTMKHAFTAVAVMQLVESGKLALADVQQRLLRVAEYPELERSIERASGQSYQSFVTSGQFDRVGLRHTFFADSLDRAPYEPLTAGHKHQQFLRNPLLIDPTEPATGYRGQSAVARTGTAIYSTAADISVWDIGLAGDILIKDPALRKMLYAPARVAGTALPTTGAWHFPGHQGLMITVGSGEGFSSLLSRFTDPNDLLCVTLLANKEGLDLTQLARKIAGAHNATLGPPAQAATMRIQQSPFAVGETLDRLEAVLRARGDAVIARVDHRKAAQAAKLSLPATEELIFGNAARGTLLMQASPPVVVDLPLRAAAWEENGKVWLAATDPVSIALQNGITGHDALVREMRAAIDSALLRAVWPE